MSGHKMEGSRRAQKKETKTQRSWDCLKQTRGRKAGLHRVRPKTLQRSPAKKKPLQKPDHREKGDGLAIYKYLDLFQSTPFPPKSCREKCAGMREASDRRIKRRENQPRGVVVRTLGAFTSRKVMVGVNRKGRDGATTSLWAGQPERGVIKGRGLQKKIKQEENKKLKNSRGELI